jgi:hypothetical protein
MNTYDLTITGFKDRDLDPSVAKRDLTTTRSSETSYAEKSAQG